MLHTGEIVNSKHNPEILMSRIGEYRKRLNEQSFTQLQSSTLFYQDLLLFPLLTPCGSIILIINCSYSPDGGIG